MGIDIAQRPVRYAKRARRFVEELVRAILRHSVIDLSAQLAYWSLLALFPFAIFLLTVVGYLPLGDVDRELMNWLSPFMPDAALNLVWETVHEIVGKQRGGLLTIALLGALWSAAGGASALQTALNRAYGVEETRPYWQRKSQALLTTIAMTLLLIIAVAGAAIGPNLIRGVLEVFDAQDSYGGFETTWRYIRWPATVGALFALVAAAYAVLPNTKRGDGMVSIGSLGAVAMWLVVTWGFRIFVHLFGAYARTYGALAAVVMLLTWFYLSGLSVILGAEINATLERLRKERLDGDPST